MSEQTGYLDGLQTPTYRIWAGMKNRCLNPNNKDFAHYGGRGIAVCQAWLEFSCFFSDMGPRPSGLTIDRIDGKGPYAPGNCRWATRKEQRRNEENVRLVFLDGELLPVVVACERLDLKHHTVRMRLLRGWPVARALETSRAAEQG